MTGKREITTEEFCTGEVTPPVVEAPEVPEEPIAPTLWTLKLHESLRGGLYTITRTPSGWAYHFAGGAIGSQGRAGFHVPFCKEEDM